jgi:hypothetical protein
VWDPQHVGVEPWLGFEVFGEEVAGWEAGRSLGYKRQKDMTIVLEVAKFGLSPASARQVGAT